MNKYLGIDVGGTNIKYAILNDEAEISDKGEVATPKDIDVKGFVQLIKEIFNKFSDITAIVMAAPGRIDSSRGYFYTSGALQYLDKTDMKAIIESELNVPFALENDGKAAALAELWKGALKDINNGIVITIGTGLGGGIVINHKLYRGSTLSAGEFSPIPGNIQEFPMNLNNMYAMQANTRYILEKYKEISHTTDDVDGRFVFDLANKGDENAIKSIECFAERFSSVIMTLQCILDVERVAIGGGISRQPLLIETIKKKIHEYYDDVSKLLPASIPDICACTYSSDANLVGALYHYLYEIH